MTHFRGLSERWENALGQSSKASSRVVVPVSGPLGLLHKLMAWLMDAFDHDPVENLLVLLL